MQAPLDTPGTVLVTGAAGRVATAIRPVLRQRFRVRLTDVTKPDTPLEPEESFVAGDLRDERFAASVTADVAAIVHLAGDPDAGAPWPRLLDVNLGLTATLLEAASRRQVRKLVIASSIHVLGGYNAEHQWPVPSTAAPYPCCHYGISKATIEYLGRHYGDEVDGSSVICLRLPLVTYPVRWRQEARAWLADADLQSLMLAALETRRGFGAYVATSNCPRPRFETSAVREELAWSPAVDVPDRDLPYKRPPYAERCLLWPQAGLAPDH